MSKCKSFMKRRKQNHKISFHFFAAPPCTPRRFKWIGKEIFGFVREWSEREARRCWRYHIDLRVRLSLEPPRAPRVRQSSKSCGFCS